MYEDNMKASCIYIHPFATHNSEHDKELSTINMMKSILFITVKKLLLMNSLVLESLLSIDQGGSISQMILRSCCFDIISSMKNMIEIKVARDI